MISPLQKELFVQKQHMLDIFPLSWFDSASPHPLLTYFSPKVPFATILFFVEIGNYFVLLPKITISQ